MGRWAGGPGPVGRGGEHPRSRPALPGRRLAGNAGSAGLRPARHRSGGRDSVGLGHMPDGYRARVTEPAPPEARERVGGGARWPRPSAPGVSHPGRPRRGAPGRPACPTGAQRTTSRRTPPEARPSPRRPPGCGGDSTPFDRPFGPSSASGGSVAESERSTAGIHRPSIHVRHRAPAPVPDRPTPGPRHGPAASRGRRDAVHPLLRRQTNGAAPTPPHRPLPGPTREPRRPPPGAPWMSRTAAPRRILYPTALGMAGIQRIRMRADDI